MDTHGKVQQKRKALCIVNPLIHKAFCGAVIHKTSSYFGDTYSYMHSLKTLPLLIKNICINKNEFDLENSFNRALFRLIFHGLNRKKLQKNQIEWSEMKQYSLKTVLFVERLIIHGLNRKFYSLDLCFLRCCQAIKVLAVKYTVLSIEY